MLLCCLILSFSAKSQHFTKTDSLELVPVPRWFVSRLIHDVKTYRIIYPRLENQAIAYKASVDSMKVAVKVLDSIQAQQIAIRDQAASVQTERIMNQQKANGELKKEIRQQRRLTVAVGILGILALIIMI